jgi:hypothetical protein
MILTCFQNELFVFGQNDSGASLRKVEDRRDIGRYLIESEAGLASKMKSTKQQRNRRGVCEKENEGCPCKARKHTCVGLEGEKKQEQKSVENVLEKIDTAR